MIMTNIYIYIYIERERGRERKGEAMVDLVIPTRF